MMHTKGLFSTLFLSVLILAAGTSCRLRKPPPADTLVVALEKTPNSLDPRLATDAEAQRMAHLMFSSIVRLGPDLKLVGDAAESWTYANLVYTFKLKPNIVFHNGDPLTAEDLIYSLDEARRPGATFSSTMGIIEKVEARYDDQERWLKLKVKSFVAPFLNDMTPVKIVPKKIAEAAGDDFYRNPIGTGPFRFVSQTTQEVNFERFENYFADKSKMAKVQFKIIKDGNTRFQKVYKGKIDFVQSSLPHAKFKVFERSNRFQVATSDSPNFAYILLNLRNPVLKDPMVRRAINQAINRQEIIDYTLEGLADPATSYLTRSNPFFNHNLKEKKLSEEQIKAIFAKYKGHKLYLKTNNLIASVERGKILANQLRKYGLYVQVQSYEWGTFYQDVKTGKFDMANMQWIGAIDPNIYRFSLHSKNLPPNGRNRGYYNNKELDRLVDKGFVTEKFEERKRIYDRVQEIVYRDLPVIPLWYQKGYSVIHKRIKDYDLPINGDFSAVMTAYKDEESDRIKQ